jgi:hypothetical protein
MEPACPSNTIDPLTGMCESVASLPPSYDIIHQMEQQCGVDPIDTAERICTVVPCALEKCAATPGLIGVRAGE